MTPARFEHRANYDHIALVLAEKLRRRTDRNSGEQWVKVVTPTTALAGSLS